MGLRTAGEFLQSLRDDRRVIFRGEAVPDVTVHPVLGRGAEHVSIDFRLADDPAFHDLLVTEDEAADGEISRYFHIPRSVEDLERRRLLIETVSREAWSFVPLIKEIGTDALFSLMIIAQQMDHDLGTDAAKRVRTFYDRCKREDLALAVAQTDVKGDRSKRPSEQPHPDLYVRIVGRDRDGIVVRGAKAHTTNAVFANEIIVLPTRAMGEADADYAVAFAVPANAPGLTMVASGRGFAGESRFDYPLSSRHRLTESLTVFDDVFVPWERVFLWGQAAYAGPLARTFVEFHRFTAVSYKPPLLELLLGAAALAADYNGIASAAHVREKLSRLIMYLETVRGLAIASAARPLMRRGIAVPDVVLTNAAKYYFARGYHDAVRDVQDLAGGLIVTGPAEEDWRNPEIRSLIEPYLAGRAGVSGEARLQLLNLIRDLTASDAGGYLEVLAIHAEGSLETQKLTVLMDYPLRTHMRFAARAAAVES